MIELRNLTKYYPVKNGVRYVLRDVSLTIPDRTNLAVLGPNGSGKSTFLRLVGGAEPADSGSIITDQEISWPLGLTSGFQGSLTGRQNVLFVCRINGLGLDESRYVINLVTTFAELGEYFDMPVTTYSSGMRARLSFGLSMAFEFDVYLIDELTSVGDMIFKEKAKAAFEKIRKRASLIFVSHNLKTLKASCQSALFLRDGMADFYPNIDEGIEAYTEYMQDHRNNNHPKRGSKTSNEKMNSSDNPESDDSPEDELTTDQDPNTPAAKKAARKAAKKAARQLARQNSPAKESRADSNLSAEQEASSEADKKSTKKAARQAAKKAARRLARMNSSPNEPGDEGTPATDKKVKPAGAKKAAKKAARQAARKTANKAARQNPSENPSGNDSASDQDDAKKTARKVAKKAAKKAERQAAKKAAKKVARKAARQSARTAKTNSETPPDANLPSN